jgi:hypothetical protein
VGTMNGQFHQPPTHITLLPKTHLNVITIPFSVIQVSALLISLSTSPMQPVDTWFHHFRILGAQYKSCSSTLRHILNCPLVSAHLGSNVLLCIWIYIVWTKYKLNILWDVTLCSPLKVNRHFGGTYGLHLQGRVSRGSYQQELCLPPASTLVSFSAYSSTLNMEVICSSETQVDSQWTTQHWIQEDRSLQHYRRENLKSYKIQISWPD